MLAFISPCYGHDPRDFTPIKRLRVRLIHLQFDKFKNIFKDTLKLTAIVVLLEKIIHPLLPCLEFQINN